MSLRYLEARRDRMIDYIVEREFPFPVYNLAEFGEELVLVFPWNSGQNITPAGASRKMLLHEQVNYGGATNEISATAGATSTFTEQFQYQVDMPAWIFLISPLILGRLTVGAGNTVTISCRVRIVARSTNETLYDETLTSTGQTADNTLQFQMPEKGANSLVKQHELLLVTVTLTATRTAGASNTQMHFRQTEQDTGNSTVVMHIHAARNHADSVLGSVKID